MSCQRTYLAKRKGGKRTRRDSSDFSAMINPNHKDNWEIPDNIGKKWNFIHMQKEILLQAFANSLILLTMCSS